MHVFHFHPVKRRKSSLLILFLCILFVPGASTGLIGGFAEGPSENRKLASFPTIEWNIESLKSLPSSIDHYISDHFGFRNDLILMYNWIKFELLNTSPNKTVIIGQDQWLYKYLAEQQGKVRVPPLMRRQWRVHFEERQDWLREQGIDFAVIVASNKHTIYPEFLPGFYSPELKNSKLNQFMAEVKGSRLHVVDLTPRLLKEKSERLIYYKTDTHWNFYGAYFGYREIAENLKRYFPERDLVNLKHANIQPRRRDTNLYRIMGVNGFEDADYITPDGGWGFKEKKPDTRLLKRLAKRGSVSVTEHINKGLPKAVVIGDSYLGWNRNFLAQHFSRGVYVNLWGTQWKHKETFPLDLFRQEQPDLVLMQFKESRLGFCSKPYCVVSRKKMTNPDEVRQARLRRIFRVAVPSGMSVKYAMSGSQAKGTRQFVLKANKQSGKMARVGIVKVEITDHQRPVKLSVNSKGKGLCHRYKEMEQVTVAPGVNSALLCVESGVLSDYGVGLTIKGVEQPDILTVAVRSHSDIPKQKRWKKRDKQE